MRQAPCDHRRRAAIAAIASATGAQTGAIRTVCAPRFDRASTIAAHARGASRPGRAAALRLCARECGPREQLCERCESGLHGLAPSSTPVPGLDAAWSAAPYEGVARDLVVALKFAARLRLARRAGAVIAERAPAGLLDGLIVPVPPARRAGDEEGSTRRRKSPRRWGRDRPAARALPAALAGAPPGGTAARRAAGLPTARAPRRPAALRRRARGRRGHHGRHAGCLRPGAAAGGCGRVVALTFARSG